MSRKLYNIQFPISHGLEVSIPVLIKQHAENAATKWWRRGGYLQDPRTRFDDLVEFDQSIEAQLDGLREAGDAGVAQAHGMYEKSIKLRSPDVSADCFVVLALAFLTEDIRAMQTVIGQVADKPGFVHALNGAFSWCGTSTIANVVEAQLGNPEPVCRHAALMQCHVHALTESGALKRALLESSESSMAVTMDAVANCGRIDLLAPILGVLSGGHSTESICFSAARSALLLGEQRHSIAALQAFSLGDTPNSIEALKLLCLAMPAQALHEHLRQFKRQAANQSLLIQASGWSGNPAYVPWLISLMGDESTGRFAGEAFRQITGFDIEANEAISEPVDVGTSSKPPYPVPDANKLDQWWQQNHQHYSNDTRYFLGRPPSAEWLNYLLGRAEQSHRELAALHRMLIKPGTMRFPTHASTYLQLQHLSIIQGGTI